jgi:hypothetical protein
MPWAYKLSSLCRYFHKVQKPIDEDVIKNEIMRGFTEYRCFPFIPDTNVIAQLRDGTPVASFSPRFTDLRNDAYASVANGDQTILGRLQRNALLSTRLRRAIALVHRAVQEIGDAALAGRRFVIVRERTGVPTLYHVEDDLTVIAHVGQGPQWTEIPTIYLGLNIFDLLVREERQGETTYFNAFKSLLKIEERAIQTGYFHLEKMPPSTAASLRALADEVIRSSRTAQLRVEAVPKPVAIKRFTAANRRTIIRELDARRRDNELEFDYEKTVKAVDSLGRFARMYKRSDDYESLREVVRLLVAASGHDVHEVRNRANVTLERLFSPKEFDAPLATQFHNVLKGATHRFAFELPHHKPGYFVRLYFNRSEDQFILNTDMRSLDLDLSYDEGSGQYVCEYRFDSLGHVDYLVFARKRIRAVWSTARGCSGRINVIPDVRGEIILEIFPDIHGHTRVYWRDPKGHTGLVYNENGEVIRLGRFSDIAAHLEDLKQRYCVTALYLLGVQKRGSNREDWAPEATSPSPFSPMSLTQIDPTLGGEKELRLLVNRAHALYIKVIVDIVPHLNRKST